MSILEQQLTKIFTEPVKTMGFELLGIEVILGRQSTLRFYIDHEDGINIKDCSKVSKNISTLLDAENLISTNYSLEISSPGLDRPLFTAKHFSQNTGNNVSLVLRIAVHNRRKWQGIIKAVNGEMITLTVEGQEKIFFLNKIQKANLVPKF